MSNPGFKDPNQKTPQKSQNNAIQPVLPQIKEPSLEKDKVKITNSDGEPLTIKDVLSLSENGEPVYPSVCVFLPNRIIPETHIIPGSSHMYGVIRYMNLFKEAGGTKDDVDELLEPGKPGKKSLVDLLVRPSMKIPRICIRKPSYRPDNWGQMVEDTENLFKGLGMEEENIRIFDFSPEMIGEALQKGKMNRLYAMPRTLVDREVFIHDSKMSLHKNDLLSKVKVFYGMTGERQLLQHDFEVFIKRIEHENPQRKEVVKALTSLHKLASTENNAGVRHLSFFEADPKAFSVNDVLNFSERLGEKDQEEKIDAQDIEELHALNDKFKSAVKSRYRKYNPDDDKSRECLLGKLIGHHPESVNLPGLQVGYLGMGSWLPGPLMDESNTPIFPTETHHTVRDLGLELSNRFKDIEYMAPYQSQVSYSPREAHHPEREVYLFLLKRKSGKNPFIEHVRFFKSQDPKYVDYSMDRVSACRLFGSNIPEHYLLYTTEQKGDDVQEKVFSARSYLTNAVPVDKIPLNQFKRFEEIAERENMMGEQAGKNAIIGRTKFADGDEAFLTTSTGRIRDIVLMEPTGSFKELDSPISESADLYASHIAATMIKAHIMGVSEKHVDEIKDSFVGGFTSSIGDMKNNVEKDRNRFLGQFNVTDCPDDLNIEKKIEKAIVRLLQTNVNHVEESLNGGISRIYHRLKKVVDTIPDRNDSRGVGRSLNHLLLSHPEAVDRSLSVMEADESFPTLSAREKEDRIDLLRLKITSQQQDIPIKKITDFVTECVKTHGRYGFAHFEDQVMDKFPGTNIHSNDGRLLYNLVNNQNLFKQLKEKGYVEE